MKAYVSLKSTSFIWDITISTKFTEKYVWPLFGDICSVIKIIRIDTPEMKQYQALFMFWILLCVRYIRQHNVNMKIDTVVSLLFIVFRPFLGHHQAQRGTEVANN